VQPSLHSQVASEQVRVVPGLGALFRGGLPTPVNVNKLKYYLHGYPSHLKVPLIKGFTSGFSIHNYQFTPVDAVQILKSAAQHPHIVDAKIKKRG
jgi:hypothetical protein